ncbi:AraC family transcriptional regulator [Klebsiella pneumoniae subsp. ozaenae]|uniref:AraC family transcriptional regulator n=1 Tax=Klebsiella pneumoniae subsp. ozaenae TaxID=574 RepID=A0A378B1T9_KLEPO|nr:AraC family transcriptional regulator [Klebsiella pneumoniae subsp. ozaenae]
MHKKLSDSRALLLKLAEDQEYRMYAVLMKQMLYLKMLAWLEDNIYCNPAIDDLAAVYGLFASVCVRRVLPVWPVTYRTVYSSTAVDHRSGQSALTRQPIAAIAWQLSYDSPQTFSRGV